MHLLFSLFVFVFVLFVFILFFVLVFNVFPDLPRTTSLICRVNVPSGFHAEQTYVPRSPSLTFLILRYLPSLILNLGNSSLIMRPSGNFFHAVSVLLTGGSFVPVTSHHNFKVCPSITVYCGFTVPIIDGGPANDK